MHEDYNEFKKQLSKKLTGMPQRRGTLEVNFLFEFMFDLLLQFIPGNAFPDTGVTQALLVALPTIVGDKARKTLGFNFTRYQLLDKRYIDTDSVSNSAGPDFVRVKFSHDMNLLLPRMGALPGVPIGRRRGSGVTVGGLYVHTQLLAVHPGIAKPDH